MEPIEDQARDYAFYHQHCDCLDGHCDITCNVCYHKTKAAFLAGAKAAARWIPVKEEMPETGVEIMVEYNDLRVFMACYENSELGFECYEPSGSQWYALKDNIITHWRPIPPNPEK